MGEWLHGRYQQCKIRNGRYLLKVTVTEAIGEQPKFKFQDQG